MLLLVCEGGGFVYLKFAWLLKRIYCMRSGRNVGQGMWFLAWDFMFLHSLLSKLNHRLRICHGCNESEQDLLLRHTHKHTHTQTHDHCMAYLCICVQSCVLLVCVDVPTCTRIHVCACMHMLKVKCDEWNVVVYLFIQLAEFHCALGSVRIFVDSIVLVL